MKIVLLYCLVAAVSAVPQFPLPDQRQVLIIQDTRHGDSKGNFHYSLEAANGIRENRAGNIGFRGQTNMQGAYMFPLPDGTLATVRYIADENGYRAESPLIPTPHPLPAHAVEQIRVAEEQRRLGIQF